MAQLSIAARKPRRSSLGKTAVVVLACLLIIAPVVLAAGIRIMPLGDSITEGDGSSDMSGYRKRLYNRLLGLVDYDVDFVGSQSFGPATFDNDNEGHGGFMAPQIAAQTFGWIAANPADIVLLHAGTNDVEKDPADIGTILDEIDRFSTDTWVVLALIINRDWGDHYDTIVFNKALRSYAENRIAQGDRIVIVDQEHALDYPDDLYDSVHPNDTGYLKMAEVWLQGLLEILPAADAGPDQSANSGAFVNLDGTGSSDRIGTIVSYSWSQTAGTPVVLANAGTATASFTAPDISGGDALSFRLTIVDDKGLTHSDECDIAINGSPVADAGGDQQVRDGLTVTLDGTRSSDPDGTVVAYQWVQTGGRPAVALIDATAAQAHFVAPAVGSVGALLTFQLTVSDDRGGQDSDTVVVGVNRPPAPDSGSSGSGGGGGGGGCFISTVGG